MDHEDMTFEEFLSGRMKDKGVSFKRLSETTGIAPNHLENMLRGNFEDMPSAPYFHGYLVRIGKILDFDGEEWWEKLKTEGFANNSGPNDALPNNRFIKRAPPKFLWPIIAAVILIVIYLAFALPRILGKPILTITFPSQNPYTTTTSTLTIVGTVQNADSLYLSGNASSEEEVAIAPDGSWQKTVLLGNGTNPFKLSAKKFLGGETDILEQIIYEQAPITNSSASGTPNPSFPTIHSVPEVPATGTFFN